MITRAAPLSADMAAGIAIRALGYLAEQPDVLDRFLALTGLTPETLRVAAQDDSFLVSVLDHLMMDEALLLAFAANEGLEPGAVVTARGVLSGDSVDAGGP